MHYLLLAILCSCLIAIVFKFSEEQSSNRLAITTFGYITSTTMSFLFLKNKILWDITSFQTLQNEFSSVLSNGLTFSNQASMAWAVIIGVITGIFYFIGFYMYQYSVKISGPGLTATFMRLGVLVPTLLSILIFRELPTLVQGFGITLAIIGIVIINLRLKKTVLNRFEWSLILLFIIGGTADFNAKFYQHYATIEYEDLFVFYIFLSALIISTTFLFIRKRPIKKSDVVFGILVGIPNQLTSRFLVKSLNLIPASLVFPIFSVGTILIVNLVNIILFKNKLTKQQSIAIFVILIALILLNL